ncbi:DNA polymerase epsilon subunit 3 [Mangifera indica]|uniref:DNA polymerase epsilon subunit 3 n=1 Tax=Mangifera indica TaxID=29780 RepID=UPI001CFB5906|nr:DNA polymerase epsilon subunit 3 [Mangifera indica]
METEKVVSEMEELPKTIVRRVVKDKLNECSPDTEITVSKDSLLAFSESARIFIHYLSATANDICKESKRQTINADDVLKAIEEIDFPEFVGPLKASLDEFKQKNAGKRAVASKSKEEKKKRKVEEERAKSIAEKNKQDKGDEDDEE